jgi:RNA-directed DNA polymerase
MKTYKNLYPQITTFENLYQAFKNAARGKRGKPDVANFEFNLEENLFGLQSQLKNQTYRPGPYYNFRILDPKPRLISAAPFRDRVVHHALCQVIEPIFERRFIHDSYACRVGKGTHKAVDRCQQFARQYPYVLQCDVQSFFPSMDHEVLYNELSRLIADRPTLGLCKQILASGSGIHRRDGTRQYFPGDDLFAPLRFHGLPIGNLTSQFWANVYLNRLDQFVKRELKYQGRSPAYLRYVDDFLLFGQDKKTLHAWRRAVLDFMPQLRLRLHESRMVVFPTHTGIPFLGWRVYPNYKLLKRRNGVAFQRRYKNLRTKYHRGEITLEGIAQSVNGWVAHVEHGHTWGLQKSLLKIPLPTPIQRPRTEG